MNTFKLNAFNAHVNKFGVGVNIERGSGASQKAHSHQLIHSSCPKRTFCTVADLVIGRIDKLNQSCVLGKAYQMAWGSLALKGSLLIVMEDRVSSAESQSKAAGQNPTPRPNGR